MSDTLSTSSAAVRSRRAHNGTVNKRKLEDNSAIEFHHTLDLVSTFVISTTQFLNKFAGVCEQKLNKVGTDIQRLEITLSLLEAKLNSIEGLEAVASTPAAANVTTTTTTTNGGSVPPPPPPPPMNGNFPPPPPPPPIPGGLPPGPPGPPSSIPLPPDSQQQQQQQQQQLEASSSQRVMTCQEDPRLSHYFMLYNKVRVPKNQLAPKMRMAGLDPDLLDTPDAPSPYASLQDDNEDDDDDEQEEHGGGAGAGGGGADDSDSDGEDSEFEDD